MNGWATDNHVATLTGARYGRSFRSSVRDVALGIDRRTKSPKTWIVCDRVIVLFAGYDLRHARATRLLKASRNQANAERSGFRLPYALAVLARACAD